MRVIPQAAAQVIAAQCHAVHYDLAALAQATALAGNPAIPLIKELTRQVAAHDVDAARWVHWGATSQDVIDTGSVLQLRAAFDLLLPRLTHCAPAWRRWPHASAPPGCRAAPCCSRRYP